jgi:hypothetical protein
MSTSIFGALGAKRAKAPQPPHVQDKSGSGRRAERWIAGSAALALSAGSLVALIAPAAAEEAPPTFGQQPDLKTWYSAPAGPEGSKAQAWEKESLPLGNGTMGAGILGSVDVDEIIINDNTYWTGGPGQNPAYNGGFNSKTSQENAANVKKAQDLLQAAWDGTTPASVSETGSITPATTPSSLAMTEIVNTVNQLWGDKTNFGTYRQLSSVVMSAGEIIVVSGSSANYENPTSPGDGSAALFDGSTATKMYADKFGAPTTARPYEVQWSYSKAYAASSYRLATGNDVPSRDFNTWQLYAKKGGGDWGLVDTVADAAFGSARTAYKTFDLDVVGEYDAYKMVVTATAGGGSPQMSEIDVRTPMRCSGLTPARSRPSVIAWPQATMSRPAISRRGGCTESRAPASGH